MDNIHTFSLTLNDYYYTASLSYVTDHITNIVIDRYRVGIPLWVYTGKTLNDLDTTVSSIALTGTLDALGISRIIN